MRIYKNITIEILLHIYPNIEQFNLVAVSNFIKINLSFIIFEIFLQYADSFLNNLIEIINLLIKKFYLIF